MPYLIAVKQCPVCKVSSMYNASEEKRPSGWIHVEFGGYEADVDCKECASDMVADINKFMKLVEKNTREYGPILDPDVVI